MVRNFFLLGYCQFHNIVIVKVVSRKEYGKVDCQKCKSKFLSKDMEIKPLQSYKMYLEILARNSPGACCL